MIEKLAGLVARFLRKVDSGAREMTGPGMEWIGKEVEKSFVFRILSKFLGWVDGIKLESYLFGNFLAPWKLVLLYFFFYTLLAIVSQVPVFNFGGWAGAISLFGASSLLIAGSAWYFARRKYEVEADGGLGHGLFLIGVVGLLVNYSWIGFPILNDAARAYYHNIGWMVFFNCFIIGVALLAAKAKRLGDVFTLLGIAILLNFASGFRTDLMVALAAVLLPAWRNDVLTTKKLVGLGALLVPIVFLVKAVLIGSGDVSYIVSARAGFTYYTLANVLEKTSVIGEPRLALNLFLQLLGVKVIQIGAVAGEATVNLPRFYTSTFAGPLWISFGLIGVVLGSIIYGFLLGRTYASSSPWGKSFYGILVGITLIWMETGPLQIYFLLTCFLVVLLILAKKL